LETRYMSVDLMALLRELVGEYGEDWDRIGEALGVLSSKAQHNWVMFGGGAAQHLGAESHSFCQVDTTATEFSGNMASRMTGFIKEHYPASTPVNYRAVSNFMWVTMEDCTHMHSMLHGRFK
ncbi:hypothetical protein GGI19_001719, partial [Coemansia pectinata]